jgi:hypothetical protein
MIVGVWFKDRDWCEKWFADFLSKINYDAVDKVIRSKVYPPVVVMKNHNYIKGWRLCRQVKKRPIFEL